MKNIIKKLLLIVVTITSTFALTSCSGGQPTVNDSSKIKTISTQDLQSDIGKSDWIVVDTRKNDAFNGWKLDNVTRGGHIKGATDFSSNWLKIDAKDKDKTLINTLKTKGITADKNVVLYDANGKDTQAVADYLLKNGIKHIYKYDVKQWASDKKLPMESYSNYQKLVPASWVHDLIIGKTPQTFTGKSFKIFEVSWGEAKNSYDKGHIPGSIHIDTDEIEAPPLWSIKSDSDLMKFALKNGITTDTTLILCGDDTMASYRIAAITKYLGVKDVRVVNGGLAAWKAAGYDVETVSHPKTPVLNFGATAPVNKNYIVDINQAKKVLANKAAGKLVDIRSLDEHIGKISGYADLKYKGRPAGSVWGHAGLDANHLQDYTNIDNTMRNASEILAMWKSQGITPDENLCFFCGSGWRAAQVLTYADVMGLKHISLYSNGWYEWSSNPINPVEVGDSKN